MIQLYTRGEDYYILLKKIWNKGYNVNSFVKNSNKVHIVWVCIRTHSKCLNNATCILKQNFMNLCLFLEPQNWENLKLIWAIDTTVKVYFIPSRVYLFWCMRFRFISSLETDQQFRNQWVYPFLTTWCFWYPFDEQNPMWTCLWTLLYISLIYCCIKYHRFKLHDLKCNSFSLFW